MKILLPSYFYPTDPAWEKVIKSASSQSIEVIVNPNSGPGLSIDPEYSKLCIKLRKAGISTLGYVSTRYGERSMDEVKGDVLKYSAWYGVENIFLDEAASGLDKFIYYQSLYYHIPGKVVLNHGTVPDPAYQEAGDVLVIFESDYQNHKSKKFPEWICEHAESQFAQIVHSCPVRDMAKAVKKIGKTSGWAYVTNGALPNPYDALPAYWLKELSVALDSKAW